MDGRKTPPPLLDDLFAETPWQVHTFAGRCVIVKREDLSTTPPMPPLSKMRGVGKMLERLRGNGVARVGVLDTRISKSGLGVAIMARRLGLDCDWFFPLRKGEDWGTPERIEALRHGAELKPLAATRYGVVAGRARKAEPGYMLPAGFPIFETVEETAAVVGMSWPETPVGTLLLAVGTGTILAGMMWGIAVGVHGGRWQAPERIVGVTASRDPVKARTVARGHHARLLCSSPEIRDALGSVYAATRVYNPGGEYYDGAQVDVGWPVSPYYEAKALRWFEANSDGLPDPVIFWNIGV